MSRKIQKAKSLTGDFENNTWTFEMTDDYEISGGHFRIVPEKKYLEIISDLKGIRNSMNVHPDCLSDSEFSDMVSRCYDVLNSILNTELST